MHKLLVDIELQHVTIDQALTIDSNFKSSPKLYNSSSCYAALIRVKLRKFAMVI